MKKSKIALGLLALGLMALIPISSSSEAGQPQTSITLSADNLLVLNAQVDGESVSELVAKAKKLDNELSSPMNKLKGGKSKHIILFLNTPGGSIQSGMELIEALNGLNHKVDTVTLFAASMGFQIVQSLNDRLILKSGVLMSHQAQGEFAGYFGGTAPSQVDSRYKLWLDRVREFDEQTVSRTNGKQTYKSYTEAYNHELWLTGTQSVAQGYADRTVTVSCDSSLSGTTTHSAEFMGMQLLYDLDACPLNTSPLNVRAKPGAEGGITITSSTTEEIKKKFLEQFQNKKQQALPFTW